MKTIVIANQKGGIGKTTTAAALIDGLSFRGYKVLSVDANAQRNLTQTLGGTTQGNTLLDLLLDKCTIDECIQETPRGDLISGHTDLAFLDLQIEGDNRTTRLKNALKSVNKKYDYCIIDSPPYMSTLLVNSLMAAEYVVVVAEADIYSVSAVEDISVNIKAAQQEYNKKLKVVGLLLTRFTGRPTLSRQLAEAYKQPSKELKTTLFSKPIREGIVIKEAHALRCNLFEYEPNSNAVQDYDAFVTELLERIR